MGETVNIVSQSPSTTTSPIRAGRLILPSVTLLLCLGVARILGYGTMGGFDYSVTAARRALTNTIAIVVQINEDNRWASL